MDKKTTIMMLIIFIRLVFLPRSIMNNAYDLECIVI